MWNRRFLDLRPQTPAEVFSHMPPESLRCKECKTTYALDARYVCEQCFGPLEVAYDYDVVRASISRQIIERGPRTLWRYKALLPVEGERVVDTHAGFTPLIRADNLGRVLGLPGVRMWSGDVPVAAPEPLVGPAHGDVQGDLDDGHAGFGEACQHGVREMPARRWESRGAGAGGVHGLVVLRPGRELAPPVVALDDVTRKVMCGATVRALQSIVPAMRLVQPSELDRAESCQGIITALARTDIDDPNSELHSRYDVGVFGSRGYHSVDPGKLTLAPYFAMECVDRILPGRIKW